MSNDLKWMLSSDHQIPYHDPRAIDLWFQVMKWFKPDVVDYLGDTSDQFCFSSFSEGTTTEFIKKVPEPYKPSELLKFVMAEEADTAKFYEDTRKKLPKAELFSALGNHDIRVWRYADKKLQDALELITPENLWGLDSLGYDYIYYQEKPRHRFGDIWVHHGMSALGESVASVKSDMGNLGVSLIRGHSHRMGAYYKTYELRNETLRGYEIGHLCKVDSEGFEYTQIHNWQQGFAIAHIENGEMPHIQLIQITPDYTCYVDGKKFSA